MAGKGCDAMKSHVMNFLKTASAEGIKRKLESGNRVPLLEPKGRR